MSKVTQHVAFTIPAGERPIADHARDGLSDLRDWQKRGYKALSAASLRILLAPTGSGKSTLIKALCGNDLRLSPAMRAVVAVPQTLIARSFGRAGLRVDRKPLIWDPGVKLFDGVGSVDALIRFLRAPAAETASARTLVCTHQTLVLAHQKMMKGRGKKPSPWANVSLAIDEAHHSKSEDGEEGESLNNRLGDVVAHWLDARPGPLLLSTATWLRANLLDTVLSDALSFDESRGPHHHFVETLYRARHDTEVLWCWLASVIDDERAHPRGVCGERSMALGLLWRAWRAAGREGAAK